MNPLEPLQRKMLKHDFLFLVYAFLGGKPTLHVETFFMHSQPMGPPRSLSSYHGAWDAIIWHDHVGELVLDGNLSHPPWMGNTCFVGEGAHRLGWPGTGWTLVCRLYHPTQLNSRRREPLNRKMDSIHCSQ